MFSLGYFEVIVLERHIGKQTKHQHYIYEMEYWETYPLSVGNYNLLILLINHEFLKNLHLCAEKVHLEVALSQNTRDNY